MQAENDRPEHRDSNEHREHEPRPGHGEHGRKDTVEITVNERTVKLEGKSATGSEIKAAAILQGVLIQQNFVLQEELPNGTSRVIGDSDEVPLREHLRFTAIAPDDNS
jgi:hypothetical protein